MKVIPQSYIVHVTITYHGAYFWASNKVKKPIAFIEQIVLCDEKVYTNDI